MALIQNSFHQSTGHLIEEFRIVLCKVLPVSSTPQFLLVLLQTLKRSFQELWHRVQVTKHQVTNRVIQIKLLDQLFRAQVLQSLDLEPVSSHEQGLGHLFQLRDFSSVQIAQHLLEDVRFHVVDVDGFGQSFLKSVVVQHGGHDGAERSDHVEVSADWLTLHHELDVGCDLFFEYFRQMGNHLFIRYDIITFLFKEQVQTVSINMSIRLSTLFKFGNTSVSFSI